MVSPEAGLNWLAKEIDALPTRPQDPFNIRREDVDYFRETLEPFWRGKTLEDVIESRHGDAIRQIKKVVKINQTDHAQGHIIPNVEKWLRYGPAGIAEEAKEHLKYNNGEGADFLKSVIIVMEASSDFMHRYAALARSNPDTESAAIAGVCSALLIVRRRPSARHCSRSGFSLSSCKWNPMPLPFLREEWINISGHT